MHFALKFSLVSWCLGGELSGVFQFVSHLRGKQLIPNSVSCDMAILAMTLHGRDARATFPESRIPNP